MSEDVLVVGDSTPPLPPPPLHRILRIELPKANEILPRCTMVEAPNYVIEGDHTKYSNIQLSGVVPSYQEKL